LKVSSGKWVLFLLVFWHVEPYDLRKVIEISVVFGNYEKINGASRTVGPLQTVVVL
jgi:hypothetical protein